MKWVGGRGRERAKEVGEQERRGCGRGDVDERLVAGSEHMRAGNSHDHRVRRSYDEGEG